LRNNPIEDEEMMNKYKIGVDHLFDYLEKRMVMSSNAPKWEELTQNELPAGKKAIAQEPAKNVEQEAADAERLERDKKVKALRVWGVDQVDKLKSQTLAIKSQILACTTFQQLNPLANKLQCIQEELSALRDTPDPMSPVSGDFETQKSNEENRVYEISRAFTHLARELKDPQVSVTKIYEYIKSIKELVEIIK